MAATRAAGIADDRVYVDPLVMTISTNVQSANIAIATMRAVRAEYPEAHMTSGLSNVSFGLPARALVNRTYLTLAVEAGLDSAILDPLDRELQAPRCSRPSCSSARTGTALPTPAHSGRASSGPSRSAKSPA